MAWAEVGFVVSVAVAGADGTAIAGGGAAAREPQLLSRSMTSGSGTDMRCKGLPTMRGRYTKPGRIRHNHRA